jgi:hypothetical protein
MTSNAYDHFIAAFERLVSDKGRGVQRRLAEALGIGPVHVNDVLKRRKRASQNLQERIGQFFGLGFEEMLALGRRIIEAESGLGRKLPFAEELSALEKGSMERYLHIYRKACEEAGLPELSHIMSRALNPGSREYEEFRSAKLDDYELFHRAKEKISRVARLISALFGAGS